MKEILQIRVNYDFAHLLFKEDEGKRLGSSIKVINLPKNDSRYIQVPKIDKYVRNEFNRAFYFGWKIIRKYNKKELFEAKLFRMKVKSVFEPSGEECGTEYDESESCEICGSNRKQISTLKLKQSSIPKKDIAKTIAGEVIVSEKFKNLCESYNLSGLKFKQVQSKNKQIEFYQIFPSSPILELTNNTIAGIDPFDFSVSSEGEIYKCPKGHTIGLNLISEVYIKEDKEINNFDFFQSEQKVGVNRGLLRPEPIYLCSIKFRELIKKEKLKGFDFEIAYLE